MLIPYYDNLEATPIDSRTCLTKVERVYGLDWNRIDDRHWQALARVYEGLPGRCETGMCWGDLATKRTCRPFSGRRWGRQGCKSTASSRRPPGGPRFCPMNRKLLPWRSLGLRWPPCPATMN